MSLQELIRELDRVSWSGKPWSLAHHQIEKILNNQWQKRIELLQNLQKHLRLFRQPIITRTAELHSWLLHDGDLYCLKLNQFKPSLCGKKSENVHDHTRPLTTLTLCGGYSHQYYRPAPRLLLPEAVGSKFNNLPAYRTNITTFPGYVSTIDPDLFHGLTDFVDGTLTLVVYGVIVKDQITVFNNVSGLVEKRTTCDFAVKEMLAQLQELENRSSQPKG